MDINNFGPFNSDVWGTVSDWTMVIMTGLTAYFLIKTFREQKRATDIEHERYVDQIKPTFKLSHYDTKITIAENKYEIESKIELSCTRTVPKILQVSFIQSKTGKWRFTGKDGNKIHFPFEIKDFIHGQIRGSFSGDDKCNNRTGCTFQIIFSDQLGNIYCQFLELEFIGQDIQTNYSTTFKLDKLPLLPERYKL
ncbi:MAG: hypothetical protein KAF41_04970 [Flavobacterium sp.]|nr:hypothetical protein [Flavobacterium sp.]PZO35030.1 MAG: hypothetical protein DCE86_00040 [Flavobacteriaceae bacterium]